MNKTEKEALVTGLGEKMKNANALYYTDFTGLNVKRITELRRRLRKAGIEYVVIKNTLMQRAARDVGLPAERMKGPTGLVIGKDAVAAAKILTEFAKEFEQKPEVKSGLFDGKAIDPAQVKKLASLPSRQEMLGQLAAGMQAPLAGFVGALSGVLYMMVGALEGLKAQKEQGSG